MNTIMLSVLAASLTVSVQSDATSPRWELGDPIVTYWAGPGYPGHPEKLTERAAQELKDGGFNTVWGSSLAELDVAEKYGLKVIFRLGLSDFVFTPERQAKIAKTVEKVRNHPALGLYSVRDEPPAGRFEILAEMRDFLHRLDPKHPAWVNLLPTYANNRQLGVDGEIIRAYHEHVRRFAEVFRPEILSYDHYQLCEGWDNIDYFLNLGIIRQSAAAQGIPFVNGVQACTWWAKPAEAASPSAPRIPGPDEMRYLVYTTLAYGAQGIYYYVYSFPRHRGSIVSLEGEKDPKYYALQKLNPIFVKIARELRGCDFKGAYMQGRVAPGATPYCTAAVLKLLPEKASEAQMPRTEYADTTLVTRFDRGGEPERFMVVNLDYRKARVQEISAPFPLERFDPVAGTWSPIGTSSSIALDKGEGVLLRRAAAK